MCHKTKPNQTKLTVLQKKKKSFSTIWKLQKKKNTPQKLNIMVPYLSKNTEK